MQTNTARLEKRLDHQMDSIFDHVFSTPKDNGMFTEGYEDAWKDDVIKPKHDNEQYKQGWSLGLEYKGK